LSEEVVAAKKLQDSEVPCSCAWHCLLG
jgi:hypothetical protein